MKVLVVGSGGREHALVWKIAQSKEVTKIFAAPGNGGMAELAECVDIKADDLEGLKNFAKENKVDLTVVGPEIPLVAGITDEFEKEGLLVFGPTREAAQLEGSKVFSKRAMSRFGVPTAGFSIFSDVKSAKTHIIEQEPPIVIKADGLAAGKGVIIADSCESGVEAIHKIMEDKVFGDAGGQVLIEDCLTGEELSILAFTDGTNILPLATSQDHKRALDGDKGPNTGGMGAYSPYPRISSEDEVSKVVEQTIKPVIKGLRSEGIVYKGLIYAGIMMTEKGPSVLEYNVRFGDPETQAVLPRLKSDIVPLFLEIAKGKLNTTELIWDKRACITVVVASGGYPGSYEKGFEIKGLDSLKHEKNVFVFHAGTKLDGGKIVTSGGRVLAVSALGETIKESKETVYEAIKKISFGKMFYRKDIGWRVLKGCGCRS